MTKLAIYEMIDGYDNFSRKDIKKKMEEKDINISDSTITRIIRKLMDKGILIKTERGYSVSNSVKHIYQYEPSDKLKEIINLLKEEYPLIKFEAWEYVELNDFVNHLIGKNSYFIEVERDYEMTFFDLLNKEYPRVLLNPTYDTFSLYANDEPIVIKRLVSRTPENTISKYQPTLEKLIVDLLHDSFTSKLISYHELVDMVEYCANKYFISFERMNSYAKRRNAKGKLDKLLQEFNDENAS